MKAITVAQPWAWAIIHGGKDVENRTQAWKYRGLLVIHAGARWSQRGADFEPLQRAYAAWLGFDNWSGPYGGHTAMPIDPATDERDRELIPRSALLGTVILAGAHRAEPGCCDSPWAQREYVQANGRTRSDLVHLVLEDPKPLPEPFEFHGGRLGLWTLPAAVEAMIAEQASG